MIDVPLEQAAGLSRGAVHVERTETGIVPLRLPPWTFAQAPDDITREIFRFSSGVRLALTTEASTLELDLAVSQIEVGEIGPAILPLVMDLVIDGQKEAQQTIDAWSTRVFNGFDNGELVDATPRVVATVRFDGLSRERKDLELWFPPNGVVELCALRADADVAGTPEQRPRWIHHGSSISHCMEAGSPTTTWPAVAARLGRMDLLNLGFGGNCQLDPFVARTIRDLPAEFISLKIGINIAGLDSFKFRTFGPAMHGFLDTIRDGHPDTPLLVVSPIVCPGLERQPGPMMVAREDDPAITDPPINALTLRRMREILAEVVKLRASDPNLRYLDGLSLFGHGDVGDLPDGVHPSADGYVRIGERFAATAFPTGAAAQRLSP